MRSARFGVIVLAFAFGCSTLIVWRIMSRPVVIVRPEPAPADLNAVKSDLCRLARSEGEFFAASGHYAEPHELRSNSNFSVPPDRWPYVYHISVPAADRFVIEAIPYRAVRRKVTVFTVGPALKVCSLSPNADWAARGQDWRELEADYSCDPCADGR